MLLAGAFVLGAVCVLLFVVVHGERSSCLRHSVFHGVCSFCFEGVVRFFPGCGSADRWWLAARVDDVSAL